MPVAYSVYLNQDYPRNLLQQVASGVIAVRECRTPSLRAEYSQRPKTKTIRSPGQSSSSGGKSNVETGAEGRKTIRSPGQSSSSGGKSDVETGAEGRKNP